MLKKIFLLSKKHVLEMGIYFHNELVLLFVYYFYN